MKKLALIGDSISHSISPKLFKAAYSHKREAEQTEFSYTLLDYPTLNEAMNIFLKEGYYGANITSPYKNEILSYCTELDITASQTGAANLILRQKDNIKGYNTDCQGVYGPLKTRGIEPCNVIILGAGGAAKAAISILQKRGFTVTVINRTLVKAKKLAQEQNVKWATIQSLPELIKTNTLLIYTIAVPTPSLKCAALNNVIIFEANYKSPSLNNSECKEYIPGTEWLVHQAIPSFKLFTK
ncbi:MAG: hypothetical protein WCR71_06865, partial [Bacteroidales bacterium]